MRLVVCCCWAVICIAPYSRAAAQALAELVSPFPQPGIWWNPAEPGTALLWEREQRDEWRAQVLEYDEGGNAVWLDLRGEPLRYRDPVRVEPGGVHTPLRWER